MRDTAGWIRSARFDTAFILAPPFAITLAAIAISVLAPGARGVPTWAWVSLVLAVDVAHVYGTLFRTYFTPSAERARLGPILYLVPAACWLAGIALYSLGPETFWRALAYVAVFHFVRQAYGFMRVYSRADRLTALERRVCAVAIYAATLYPLIHWHLSLPRKFSWFTDGDFVDLGARLGEARFAADHAALTLYVGSLLAYVVFEARRYLLGFPLAMRRIAIVAGTALSWYVGIVALNGDLAFTATNVISHGVPYIALTFAYWTRPKSLAPSPPSTLTSTAAKLTLFVGCLVLFAYVEEALWDALISHEHPAVFAWLLDSANTIGAHIHIVTRPSTLAWLVPLLALPQSTHYVLDAFVWKLKDRGSEWTSMLSRPSRSDASSSSISKAAIRRA